MLWIGYVYTTNLVYHLSFLFWTDIWWDQLPLLLPKCFLNHIFHNQHLAPFSLRKFLCGKPRHFKSLCFQMTFHSFSFSVMLFLCLIHIYGERTTSVTIFVDERSSALVSSWMSTCTGPSISALSTKLILVLFGVSTWIYSKGSSVKLFSSSQCSLETIFCNSSSVNMALTASSGRFDVFNPTFIGWSNIASHGEHSMSFW